MSSNDQSSGYWLPFLAAVVFWPFLFLVIGPGLVLLGGVGLGLFFFCRYVAVSAQTMLPDRFAPEDRCLLGPRTGAGGDEPAFTQYFFGQAIADYRHIHRMAFEVNRRVATGPWCADLSRWLVSGHSRTSVRPELSPLTKAFTIPLGVIVALALVLSAAIASILIGAVGLLHLLTITLALVLCMSAALALRGLAAARCRAAPPPTPARSRVPRSRRCAGR